MKYKLLLGILLSIVCDTLAQEKIKLNLLPGQGSDHRVFQRLQLDTGMYDTVHIHYPVPDRKDDMRSYARSLLPQIDTSGRYAFLGVSLGGMLSCELGELCDPEQIFLVSSAKNRFELPWAYRTQRWLPVYRIIPASWIKASSFILQPLFESDRHEHKEVFKAMLRDKDKHFVKRAIRLIVTWDREEGPSGVVHLHGAKDSTLPLRRIEADHVLEDGTHMMMLNDTPWVQEHIEEWLSAY